MWNILLFELLCWSGFCQKVTVFKLSPLFGMWNVKSMWVGLHLFLLKGIGELRCLAIVLCCGVGKLFNFLQKSNIEQIFVFEVKHIYVEKKIYIIGEGEGRGEVFAFIQSLQRYMSVLGFPFLKHAHSDRCMFRWLLKRQCSHFGMMQYICHTHSHTRTHTHTLRHWPWHSASSNWVPLLQLFTSLF